MLPGRRPLASSELTRGSTVVPILKPGTLEFISHNAEQTIRLGQRLGEMLRPGDILCLYGALGAGKTAFARGVGRGWGAIPGVTSPTFVLVHEHTRQADDLRLIHVDAYRLAGPEDALTFGLDELLADRHPVLIEWPERVAELLPAERLNITFNFLDSERRQIFFEALGKSYEDLLEAFRRRTFGA